VGILEEVSMTKQVLCYSKGPRIGEASPYCKRHKGHSGSHWPAEEDGWGNRVTWSNLDDIHEPTQPDDMTPIEWVIATRLVSLGRTTDPAKDLTAAVQEHLDKDDESLRTRLRDVLAVADGTGTGLIFASALRDLLEKTG
jgi:hypothetical protein